MESQKLITVKQMTVLNLNQEIFQLNRHKDFTNYQKNFGIPHQKITLLRKKMWIFRNYTN